MPAPVLMAKSRREMLCFAFEEDGLCVFMSGLAVILLVHRLASYDFITLT